MKYQLLIPIVICSLINSLKGMDLTALYTLHTRLAAEERHKQREIARSIESIEAHIPLRQRVFKPKNLSDPARFLAIHYISKGCTKALETQQKISETSPIKLDQASYGSVDILTDVPLEQETTDALKASKDSLSTIQNHIPYEDLERIISCYTGAFALIAQTNPALYSSSLCWAVSCNNLAQEEREAFDAKCFSDCAVIVKAYTTPDHSPCCTIL